MNWHDVTGSDDHDGIGGFAEVSARSLQDMVDDLAEARAQRDQARKRADVLRDRYAMGYRWNPAWMDHPWERDHG